MLQVRMCHIIYAIENAYSAYMQKINQNYIKQSDEQF